MDLRLLRSFLAAASEQNICRAASNLHLTQSALSRRIKTFENELGIALLDRGAHSFSLTPAGRVLQQHGPELLDHDARLEKKVKATANRQTIRIGYAPSLAAGLLAKAMRSFAVHHPQVHLELRDTTYKRMVEELQENMVDIALTVTPDIECEGIRWYPIVKEKYQVLIPEGHPWCSRDTVSAEDFRGQKIVIFDRAEYPAYWGRIYPWARTRKLAIKIAAECDGIASLTNAVEAGLGVAVVLERSIHGLSNQVNSKPLLDPPEAVSISVGLRKDSESSDALRDLIEALRNAARS